MRTTNGIIYRFLQPSDITTSLVREEREPVSVSSYGLHPTHVPRTDWRDDPEAVGGVWTEQGRLFGTLSIPADTFYSLFPCLASNHFKELELRLLRMHYRQGDIDGIEFAPKETPMEDLLQKHIGSGRNMRQGGERQGGGRSVEAAED